MAKMTVYHGGYTKIEQPKIIPGKNTKDFGNGFYCTIIREQAERWAKRYNTPVVNTYTVRLDSELDILEFSEMTDEWLDFIVDCRSGKGLSAYHPLVRRVLADKIRQNEEKGMPGKALRVMVVGIPNTGKSSFINRMAGKSRAKVADKPGVTRHNQWFAIGNGIELLDTPGVLWPKFDDPKVGDKLAFIGSVKDEVTDSETMACRLLEVLKSDYIDLLCERYKLDCEAVALAQSYEVLEFIAKKRGMLLRGGEYDYERASVMLLDEYRAGKLGRISFEKPELYK